MKELEAYYQKFNEEKRLNSRHGQVEYRISMKYIHDFLPPYDHNDREKGEIRILDVGAGTGKYAVPLSEEGYDVTAVEPMRGHLGVLKAKKSRVKAMEGNALHLSKLADETFDLTLLFGPMYHLFSLEDKVQALKEAKRVTKTGGVIFVAYCMNEYGVLSYAFKEQHIEECIENGRLTEDFHIVSEEKDLYDYVRTEDIRRISEAAGLRRIKLISPDGPANYMRPYLKRLTEAEFERFLSYQLSICERQDLIGAGAHTVDILRKEA